MYGPFRLKMQYHPRMMVFVAATASAAAAFSLNSLPTSTTTMMPSTKPPSSSSSRPTTTSTTNTGRTLPFRNQKIDIPSYHNWVSLLNSMVDGSLSSITSSSSTKTLCEAAITNSTYDPSSYYYEKIDDPPPRYTEAHAIFGPLKKKGHIERFDVYKLVFNNDDDSSLRRKGLLNNSTMEELLLVNIKIGSKLNGHEGIVHGGIISLLFDEIFGWGYEGMYKILGEKGDDGEEVPMAVTANLNVNFRAPLKSQSDVIIRVFQEKMEGRKIYLKARMESPDRSILYAEASALFIKIDKKKVTKQ